MGTEITKEYTLTITYEDDTVKIIEGIKPTEIESWVEELTRLGYIFEIEPDDIYQLPWPSD